MDIYINQSLCEYTLECLDGELKHNGRTRRVYEVAMAQIVCRQDFLTQERFHSYGDGYNIF
jgi:hypothetical protein